MVYSQLNQEALSVVLIIAYFLQGNKRGNLAWFKDEVVPDVTNLGKLSKTRLLLCNHCDILTFYGISEEKIYHAYSCSYIITTVCHDIGPTSSAIKGQHILFW